MDGASAASRIGRYEVVRRIGAGGMGEVFLARAKGPGGIAKQVCIKRTLPGRAMDPGSVQRFLDEARTALSLQHANVVPVFDFGRDADGLYLVMEWIDGCDLGALIDRPLPPLVAAHVAAEVCKALAYAHERTDGGGRPAGLLHCDVTPRNVLLSRLGEVRLTDFGIARASSAVGRGAGTPAYMAPEAASGGASDPRSDLYSLGLVLAEMLLGRPLRAAREREEARRPAPVPALDGVPEEIAAVVRRLLAPSPAERFPSAAAALAALMPALAAHVLAGGVPPAQQLARLVTAAAPRQELAEGGGLSTEAGLTRGTDEPRPRRRWWLLAPLALLGLGAGAWWWRSTPVPPVAVAPPVSAPSRKEEPPVAVPPELPPAVHRAPARLRIKTPGSWVAVWIDGDKRGDDAGEFEIAAGRHRLRVENPPLHFREDRSIVARPGEVVTLTFNPLAPRR